MDELVAKVIAVLKGNLGTHFGRQVTNFYTGDPLLIPLQSLPAIAVSPSQNAIAYETQIQDLDTTEMVISVIDNARQDFNQTPDKVTSTQFLMDIMEGRNQNGTLKTNTIRYLVRHDPTLSGKILQQDMRIDYSLLRQRGEVITREAQIHVRTKRVTTF